jgi:AMP nucleosidase
MIPEGVKTEASDKLVTERYVEDHVRIGIEAMRMIIEEKRTVKHLKYEW